MDESQAFISDPAHLTSLAGQRYVVLRIHGEVLQIFRTSQTTFRKRLAGLRVSYPAYAHVTLRGFPAGTALPDVQGAVAMWAAETPPLVLDLERIMVFPPPWQIIFLGVRKTPELVRAFSQLESVVRRLGLPDWPESQRRDVTDWVFHISLAYCERLDAREWESIARDVSTLPVPRASCVVDQAEAVAYDGGREHPGGTYTLSF